MIKEETVIDSIAKLEGIDKHVPVLSFMQGPAIGQIHVLKDGVCIVGRSQDSAIVVLDDAISRQHFRLLVNQNETIIEDLDSTNGTFVNGVKLSGPTLLKDKDTIQISGQTVIAFSHMTNLEAQRHAQIYQMANFDPITQARSKAYFLDQLELEFSHARRHNQMLALILFDIDFFKKVNDTYGHLAGDQALRQVADLTCKVVRGEDLFARFGGEEFAILMRGTRERDALKLAERLRQLIAGSLFFFEKKSFRLTISAGVSCLKGNNFRDATEMLKVADQYLYFSKHNGRNRVASFQVLAASK